MFRVPTLVCLTGTLQLGSMQTWGLKLYNVPDPGDLAGAAGRARI